MKLERHEATTSTAGLYPDVTPSSGGTTTSAAGCGSSSSGVCAVPNCSANCGGGRPSAAASAASLIRQTNGTEQTTMAFNSSCQQCIAERAAVGSTNSAVNSTISK